MTLTLTKKVCSTRRKLWRDSSPRITQNLYTTLSLHFCDQDGLLSCILISLCFSLSSEYQLIKLEIWIQISRTGQHNFYQDSDTKVVWIYAWLIQKITTNLSKIFKTDIKFKWRSKSCITSSPRNICINIY